MLFGKLLPREGNFFELFNQHGAYIAEGARAFIRLIQHYADPELRDKHANEVGHAERQADKITAEVNRLLHKTFITPIDREQIHGLINAMDDILDLLQDLQRLVHPLAGEADQLPQFLLRNRQRRAALRIQQRVEPRREPAREARVGFGI